MTVDGCAIRERVVRWRVEGENRCRITGAATLVLDCLIIEKDLLIGLLAGNDGFVCTVRLHPTIVIVALRGPTSALHPCISLCYNFRWFFFFFVFVVTRSGHSRRLLVDCYRHRLPSDARRLTLSNQQKHTERNKKRWRYRKAWIITASRPTLLLQSCLLIQVTSTCLLISANNTTRSSFDASTRISWSQTFPSKMVRLFFLKQEGITLQSLSNCSPVSSFRTRSSWEMDRTLVSVRHIKRSICWIASRLSRAAASQASRGCAHFRRSFDHGRSRVWVLRIE